MNYHINDDKSKGMTGPKWSLSFAVLFAEDFSLFLEGFRSGSVTWSFYLGVEKVRIVLFLSIVESFLIKSIFAINNGISQLKFKWKIATLLFKKNGTLLNVTPIPCIDLHGWTPNKPN